MTDHRSTANIGVTWLKPAAARIAGAALAAFALLATVAVPAASGGDATPAAPSGGEITLSMAVKPGQPVPMRVVTEKSSEELYGKGYRGQGIDVALVDSGVAPVEGLDQPGKILYGPDLSREAGVSSLTNTDTYGHGTHLAGIIAGDDRNGDDDEWDEDYEHEVVGVAPESRIVSVKVAGADGATNIDQVIAGIDWVIEHKNDNGLNIRVLNLSFGMPGVPTNANDPLSAAVERAWDAGIVVVAAAGNRGNHVGGLDSPAVSPYVIAVGAHESYDSSGAQDWIAPWSSGGNKNRQVDIVAPGRSILSLRVPGSTLDKTYPSAVVDERFFRGSGSSQSAAVVSGFAAALLSRDPSLTPDQVKFLLMATAADLKETPFHVDGHGKIQPLESARNIESAVKAPVQVWPRALKGSESKLVESSGATWSGGTWSGGTWSGGTWSGGTWSGGTWSGATWSGGTWSGGTWSGGTWSGGPWSGSTWSSAGWD